MKKEDLQLYLDQNADELFAIAQDLYDNPEISQEGVLSAEKFKKLLKKMDSQFMSLNRKN